MMASTKRIQKELQDIRSKTSPAIRNLNVDENNLLVWNFLIVPDSPPYNKGAFKVQITFPAEYPFKPPVVTFRTRIYHPNINEEGQICLPLIQAGNWKPATKVDQVIQAIVNLINTPEPDHPLRANVAKEFTENKAKFHKTAEEETKKYAEKRPVG